MFNNLRTFKAYLATALHFQLVCSASDIQCFFDSSPVKNFRAIKQHKAREGFKRREDFSTVSITLEGHHTLDLLNPTTHMMHLVHVIVQLWLIHVDWECTEAIGFQFAYGTIERLIFSRRNKAPPQPQVRSTWRIRRFQLGNQPPNLMVICESIKVILLHQSEVLRSHARWKPWEISDSRCLRTGVNHRCAAVWE